VQKYGESLLFLAPLFRAFAAFPPPKNPKISENHNRVFPQPHGIMIQNLGGKLLLHN
jgi:hypothetical protein